MAVEYSDFLSIAESGMNSDKEIELRNSISRSYYGVFHASKPVGDKLPEFADINGGTHYRYISRFKEHANKEYRQIGYMLDWSHQQRCNADYKLDANVSKGEANNLYIHANKILELLSSLDGKD